MSEAGLGLRFQVKIDGRDFGNWQKCDGLAVEYDVFEYKEGGENGYVHRLPGRTWCKPAAHRADEPANRPGTDRWRSRRRDLRRFRCGGRRLGLRFRRWIGFRFQPVRDFE